MVGVIPNSFIAATGLGQPTQFFNLVHNLGLECEAVNVADHAVLDLDAIENAFQPDIVVITAKDAVKLEMESCNNVWFGKFNIIDINICTTQIL